MLRRLLSIIWRKPEPVVTLVHPQLGTLRYIEGIWHAEASSPDGVEVSVAGSQVAPDERQLERLLGYLGNISALKQQIHDFLTRELASLPQVQASDFYILSLDFLWPNEQDYFMVDLKMEGDKHGLWKLEFVGGQPKLLSRDD